MRVETILRHLARLALRYRKPLKRLLPVHSTVLLSLADFKMYVRLDDWVIGARIAIRRQYEPHVVAAMKPFLRPGAVIVDVGANIGYHTLMAARHIGRAGKVIAFEPATENCNLLARSLAANGFHNVTIHAAAVADVSGFVGFRMDDSNGAIDPEPGQNPGYPEQVPAVTLDACLGEEPRIDVIKVDVEGAEGRALRGMEATLAKHRPVLFVEFTPGSLEARSRMKPREFLSRLEALGYGLRTINRDHGAGQLAESEPQPLASAASSDRGYVDLLALPMEGGRVASSRL